MAGVRSRVTPIVALDVPDARAADRLVDDLGGLCAYYKVGSELFTAAGPAVVESIRARGASVFLDLKFHDIPNTVRGAVRAAASLGVRLLTVHLVGGRSMLEAAAAAARDSGDCEVLGVTVLTSLDVTEAGRVWGRAVADMRAEVMRLAQLAADAGLHGVVCSGTEAGAVRDRFGDRLATLVPGIRLQGGDPQDQSRVVTPRAAAESGARYIVLGRAVTAAPSPRAAMEAVLADLS
jgi:orotidine-5'-phosphate decarboxylase